MKRKKFTPEQIIGKLREALSCEVKHTGKENFNAYIYHFAVLIVIVRPPCICRVLQVHLILPFRCIHVRAELRPQPRVPQSMRSRKKLLL
jgi:hypothetical protein